MPELRYALRKIPGDFSPDLDSSLVVGLRKIFEGLAKGESVEPTLFITVLRTAFPQFAQKSQQTGAFQQQDAEECWGLIMSVLSRRLASTGSKSADALSFIDTYMTGEITSVFVASFLQPES